MTEYQPRFAAFMASWARSDAAFARGIAIDFMAWIARCKATAIEPAVRNGRVEDHDAFTAHCWSVARDDLLARFPA